MLRKTAISLGTAANLIFGTISPALAQTAPDPAGNIDIPYYPGDVAIPFFKPVPAGTHFVETACVPSNSSFNFRDVGNPTYLVLVAEPTADASMKEALQNATHYFKANHVICTQRVDITVSDSIQVSIDNSAPDFASVRLGTWGRGKPMTIATLDAK